LRARLQLRERLGRFFQRREPTNGKEKEVEKPETGDTQ